MYLFSFPAKTGTTTSCAYFSNFFSPCLRVLPKVTTCIVLLNWGLLAIANSGGFQTGLLQSENPLTLLGQPCPSSTSTITGSFHLGTALPANGSIQFDLVCDDIPGLEECYGTIRLSSDRKSFSFTITNPEGGSFPASEEMAFIYVNDPVNGDREIIASTDSGGVILILDDF